MTDFKQENSQNEEASSEPVQPTTPQPEAPYYQNQQQQYQSNYGSRNDFSNEIRPNNSLALAIVATVLSLITCCGYVSCIGVITGIIAIVFATQVNAKYDQGDYLGAVSTAKNAKILAYVTLGTVALSLIWIIIALAMGGFAAFMNAFTEAYNQASQK